MNPEPCIDVTCTNCGIEWELSKEEFDKGAFFCDECKTSFDTEKGSLLSREASGKEPQDKQVSQSEQVVPERKEIYYIRLFVAIASRCFSIYFLWRGFLILLDYYHASAIYFAIKPGFPISEEYHGNIDYLQSKWGSGISLELCHMLLVNLLGRLLLSAILWFFCIPIARIFIRNFDKI